MHKQHTKTHMTFTLIFNRLLEIATVREQFVQNFIKLSAAIHELSS